MTLETFIVLSRLPRLENLSLSAPLIMDYVADHTDKRIITAQEESENILPFPSLYYFAVSDVYDYGFTIAKALGCGIPLSALNTLDCSPYCISSDETIALMESVHIVCPSLQSISISGENYDSDSLPWRAIEALLQCPDLNILKVSNCTIDMELQDIITVATNRSLWISVVLPPRRPFAYQALVAFAKNCPHLNEWFGVEQFFGVSCRPIGRLVLVTERSGRRRLSSEILC